MRKREKMLFYASEEMWRSVRATVAVIAFHSPSIERGALGVRLIGYRVTGRCPVIWVVSRSFSSQGYGRGLFFCFKNKF